jgi:hypothetical protein
MKIINKDFMLEKNQVRICAFVDSCSEKEKKKT